MIGNLFARPIARALQVLVAECVAGGLNPGDVSLLIALLATAKTGARSTYNGLKYIDDMCPSGLQFVDVLTTGGGEYAVPNALGPRGNSPQEAYMRVLTCGCAGTPGPVQPQIPMPGSPPPFVQLPAAPPAVYPGAPPPVVAPPVIPGMPPPPAGVPAIPPPIAPPQVQPPAIPAPQIPPAAPPPVPVPPVIVGPAPGKGQVPGINPTPRQATAHPERVFAEGFLSGGAFREVAEKARNGITKVTASYKASGTDDTLTALTAFRGALDSLLSSTTADQALVAARAAAMMRSAVFRALRSTRSTNFVASTEGAPEERLAIGATALLVTTTSSPDLETTLAGYEREFKSSAGSRFRKIFAAAVAKLRGLADKFEDNVIANPKTMKELMAIIEDLLTGNESPRNLGFWSRLVKLLVSAWGDDLWRWVLSGRSPVAYDTFGEDTTRALFLNMWTPLAGVIGAREDLPDKEIDAGEQAKADQLVVAANPPAPKPGMGPGKGGGKQDPGAMIATLASAAGTVAAGVFGGPAASEAAAAGFNALGFT